MEERLAKHPYLTGFMFDDRLSTSKHPDVGKSPFRDHQEWGRNVFMPNATAKRVGELQIAPDTDDDFSAIDCESGAVIVSEMLDRTDENTGLLQEPGFK